MRVWRVGSGTEHVHPLNFLSPPSSRPLQFLFFLLILVSEIYIFLSPPKFIQGWFWMRASSLWEATTAMSGETHCRGLSQPAPRPRANSHCRSAFHSAPSLIWDLSLPLTRGNSEPHLGQSGWETEPEESVRILHWEEKRLPSTLKVSGLEFLFHYWPPRGYWQVTYPD